MIAMLRRNGKDISRKKEQSKVDERAKGAINMQRNQARRSSKVPIVSHPYRLPLANCIPMQSQGATTLTALLHLIEIDSAIESAAGVYLLFPS
jgi:hypothetical protein